MDHSPKYKSFARKYKTKSYQPWDNQIFLEDKKHKKLCKNS